MNFVQKTGLSACAEWILGELDYSFLLQGTEER